MKRYTNLIVILAALAAPILGQAKARTTLGVMDITCTGISAEEGKILTETLLTGLVNAGIFDIVERSRRDEILKEQGFQQTGACDDASCLVEIGKYLAVQKIVGGSVGKFGSTWTVNIRLLDVQTGKVEKAVTKTYKGEMDVLLTAMQAAAAELSGRKAAASAQQPEEGALPKLASAAEYYQKGKELRDGGNYLEAIRYYSEAIRLDPNQAVYYAGRGYAQLYNNDYEAAQTDFQRAAIIEPDYAWAAIGQGDVSYRKKEYAQALSHYSRALEMDKSIPDIDFKMHDAYHELKEYDQAIACINQLLRHQPNNQWAYNVRGLDYYYRENYQQAVEDYSRAIQISSSEANFYCNRGMARYQLKQYQAALEDLSKAIILKPENAVYYDWRAAVYRKLNDNSAALADINRAIELKPNNADYYSIRAHIYGDMKDYANTIRDFSKAIEIEPTKTNYLFYRADAYSDHGDYAGALADYTKAVEYQPGKERPYHERGGLNIYWADYYQAIKDETRALEIKPDYVAALTNRAVAFYQLRDSANALADCKRIMELTAREKDNSGSFGAQAIQYFFQGKYEKAVDTYTKALKIDPEWPGALYRRGDAYSKMGKAKEAEADWRSANEMNRFYPPSPEARKAIGVPPIQKNK